MKASIAARQWPVLFIAALTAIPARAAVTNDVFSVPIASGSVDLGGYQIIGVEPGTATVFDLFVTAHARWNANIPTQVTYDRNDVRQGANLAVSRAALLAGGAIRVDWSVSGTVAVPILGTISIGTIPLSIDTISCLPRFSGATFRCTATSGALTLVASPVPIPASPYVDMVLEIAFDVTPEGVVTTRGFSISDDPVLPSADLQLTGTPATEIIPVPCTRPVGEEVAYSLDPFRWSPATHATQQPHFQIGIFDPVFGVFKVPPAFDAPFGVPVQANPTFVLTGAGHTTPLGTLQANNILPSIAAFPLFTGQEGTPVQFSASITSQCPIGGYVWQFSDGTLSFGPTPQRAFGDDGLYNGQLNITDVTNLSASRDFNVSIENVLPFADPGPDTGGAWGMAIAFHGQAVDPGWNDQPTLRYSWNWGDGTPGTGGAEALHAYRFPGEYIAALTVCDDHGCATSNTHVHVRKRGTFVAYTGATSGVYSAQAPLGASVDDEFGSPVVAASVDFTLAGSPAGTAQTDSGGNAQGTTTVNVPAGSYAVTAAYSGSSFYDGNSTIAGFTVAPMSSSIRYTGALGGGANKTVTLSAILTDSLGRGLDGKLVVFVLGTQTAQAVTSGGGIAATPLKLDQKNGKYELTATWTPSGADASKWTAASTVTAFSLQAK